MVRAHSTFVEDMNSSPSIHMATQNSFPVILVAGGSDASDVASDTCTQFCTHTHLKFFFFACVCVYALPVCLYVLHMHFLTYGLRRGPQSPRTMVNDSSKPPLCWS